VNRQTLLDAIQERINNFSNGLFEENALRLFETLGYRSDRRIANLQLTATNIAKSFNSPHQLNEEKALVNDWLSVNLLFQLTDDEIHITSQLHMIFDSQRIVDPSIYRSYLFMGLELKKSHYSRTQLAELTREINRLFAIPVMILFKHGESLTLAVIHRRPNQRDNNIDVLEKVTLIKDILIQNTNRAHKEILADLSLEQLFERRGFTNFLELHKAWQDTLSISELNKSFYSELANWYFWAQDYVRFPKGADSDEKKCNSINVIRLITRLIFIWFIKEKGLVKEDLFDREKLNNIIRFGSEKDTVYYKAVLQNLFFASLNTSMNKDEPGSRTFAKDGISIVDDYLVTNKFRYRELIQNPNAFLSLFEEIPFLNGGLFECLDHLVTEDDIKENPTLNDRIVKEGNYYVLRVDGFSRRRENPIYVPDFLFFDKKHPADLNKAYGTTNKKYEVRGIIDLLSHYKFTIEENTPIEEEIALDPELLGKAFENLLATFNPETETSARKQTGSFYTPREIVNYMVDESLLAYLQTKLSDKVDIGQRLRHLLDYNIQEVQFNDEEKEQLIRAIDEVKVLDPACGSGAFPMGILQKLVYVLQRIDPKSKRWRELQREKAIRESNGAYQLEDHFTRKKRLEEIENTFTNYSEDYGRKLCLIENCIYGVDIQPIAIQIAKLRFFISLVVEQDLEKNEKNFGIQPLPNLETKFVAADTLMRIEKPKIESAISFGDHLVKEKRAELKRLRHAHFSIKKTKEKRQYQEEDKKIRKELTNLLQGSVWQSDASYLANWDPYDPNSYAHFFDPDWMFMLEDGFDIVIENPPYGAQIPENQKDYLKKRHDSIAERIRNSFLYFMGESYNLAKEGGVICMILPNEFLFQIYMTKARNFFLKNSRLLFAVNVGEDVFKAIVPTCIIAMKKERLNEYPIPVADLRNTSLEQLPELLVTDKFTKTTNQTILASPNAIFSFDLKTSKLINQLSQNCMPFENYCDDIANGISTSCDEVYIVTSMFARENGFEEKYLKECIRGGQFNRFYCPSHTNEFVLYITDDFNPKVGKNIYQYLLSHKDLLIRKSVEKNTGKRDWHILFRSRYEELFSKPKILFRQTGDHIVAAIDNEIGFYCINSVHVGLVKNKYWNDLDYFIGILNSRLITFYYREISQEKGRVLAEVKPQRIRALPIHEGSFSQKSCLTEIVRFLNTLLVDQNGELIPGIINKVVAQDFDDLLNGIVYELYFEDILKEKNLDIIKLISPLMAQKEILNANERISTMKTVFQSLKNSNSEIRARLVRQNIEVEEIRIINEALKK
jgi:hypothetical protein